jgi:hypothetical protein
MVQVVNSAEAVKRRRVYKSPGTGIEHWAIAFFGNRGPEVKDEPEALMTEMSADETIVSHFHAVDQFQIFVAGSGALGRHDAQPVTLQYIDRHTGYGPIQAGPLGLSYIVLRAQTDVGAVYLNQPGYREKLKPSKKRNRLSGPLPLSTEPVLINRSEMALERLPLLQDEDLTDGAEAFMLRLGANMSTTGPDPKAAGGYYVLVVNGSLHRDGEDLPLWSILFAGRDETPLELRAGPKGVEALIMQFPQPDG